MSASRIKKTNNVKITLPPNGLDYELIDCGDRRKLERFGSMILNRPEIEANWPSQKPASIWQKADWTFIEEKSKKGRWLTQNNAAEKWQINYQKDIAFQLQLTKFKHIGIFPEQAANWFFIERELQKIQGSAKVLNLFAYTGAASVVAAKNGAQVTNVDSVKQVLNWGRENAKINQVDTIRWIMEDASKFVEKAVRRGEQYDGIIMDPPAFGHGPKKERWKLEKDLPHLLKNAMKLLRAQQHFFILNTYSPRMTMNNLTTIFKKNRLHQAHFDVSVLNLQSQTKQNLPLGNLVRWSTL